MTKRNAKQRRHQIVTLLNEQGEVQVDALAALFDTSEVTIRKDLSQLEKNGLLLRRLGGAVRLPAELLHHESEQKVSLEKKMIAEAAADMVKDHFRIVVDSGHTTAALIPALEKKQGLVIMTNSLISAELIQQMESEPTLLMTGGTWDPCSESFQGQVAENVLRAYDFDQLFIGADGIDLQRGTTTFNELVGLSQVMAEVAREVVVMISSDKLGRKIPNLELPWKAIDTLITDSGLDEVTRKGLINRGINLKIVSMTN